MSIIIFTTDDKDRERFLKLLYLCNSKQSIDFREDIVRVKIDAWDFEKGNDIVFIGAWAINAKSFSSIFNNKMRKQGFRKMML